MSTKEIKKLKNELEKLKEELAVEHSMLKDMGYISWKLCFYGADTHARRIVLSDLNAKRTKKESRISELESDIEQLEAYITQAR